ncbi:PAS domain S-box protein [Fictibacillus nanhaiensis]|uniref:PAS domain S-box protein n=1 Tax=Fictibacillus nanhaiensis TaxID=742169 RepID=UPI001C943ED0|nr:PAS domain S-box protein [Fictibacillus nanhaiensis]MBY6036888.1 PAS domain S-box protein [Fictibacillus nanhaiensis]
MSTSNGDTLVMDSREMYRQIVEYSFETTIIHADHKVLYINQSGADFLRSNKESIIGANVLDIFLEDAKSSIEERIRLNIEHNIIGELIELKVMRFDGTLVDVELYCHPVQFGQQKAVQSILRDITPRIEAEKKLKKLMNEVSTPIVPVSDGISVIPLVGSIDEDKAIQLLDFIPSKIQNENLNYLILDFSGTYNLDETVVDFLFKINSIMKLLGIRPILTGIRPELAYKAVEMGQDFSSIKTMKNVKEALRILK